MIGVSRVYHTLPSKKNHGNVLPASPKIGVTTSGQQEVKMNFM
jgi:hypothetical protein